MSLREFFLGGGQNKDGNGNGNGQAEKAIERFIPSLVLGGFHQETAMDIAQSRGRRKERN